MLKCFMNYFMIADKFNIWFISVLTYVDSLFPYLFLFSILFYHNSYYDKGFLFVPYKFAHCVNSSGSNLNLLF